MAPTYHMEGVPGAHVLVLFENLCRLLVLCCRATLVAVVAVVAVVVVAVVACLLDAAAGGAHFLVRTLDGETSWRDPLHMVGGYQHCIVT